MWARFWQFCAASWQLRLMILGSWRQGGMSNVVGLGYRGISLYARGVMPTMCLKVLMKALTLL